MSDLIKTTVHGSAQMVCTAARQLHDRTRWGIGRGLMKRRVSGWRFPARHNASTGDISQMPVHTAAPRWHEPTRVYWKVQHTLVRKWPPLRRYKTCEATLALTSAAAREDAGLGGASSAAADRVEALRIHKRRVTRV